MAPFNKICKANTYFLAQPVNV